MSIIEMFGGGIRERDNTKRIMYDSLRGYTLRLKDFVDMSEEKSGVQDYISGKTYFPEVGPGYCNLTVKSEKENTKEEIYGQRDLSYFNYIVATLDCSIKPMEYKFDGHEDCVIENVYRILGEVDNLLRLRESSESQ